MNGRKKDNWTEQLSDLGDLLPFGQLQLDVRAAFWSWLLVGYFTRDLKL
jgi:hypothetical protein